MKIILSFNETTKKYQLTVVTTTTTVTKELPNVPQHADWPVIYFGAGIVLGSLGYVDVPAQDIHKA